MPRSLRSQYLLVSLVTFVAMLGLLLWKAQHLMAQVLTDRFEHERQAFGPSWRRGSRGGRGGRRLAAALPAAAHGTR